jgi:hypothetical protein
VLHLLNKLVYSNITAHTNHSAPARTQKGVVFRTAGKSDTKSHIAGLSNKNFMTSDPLWAKPQANSIEGTIYSSHVEYNNESQTSAITTTFITKCILFSHARCTKKTLVAGRELLGWS